MIKSKLESLIIKDSKPIEFDNCSNLKEESIFEIFSLSFKIMASIFKPSIIKSLNCFFLWKRGKKLDLTLSNETKVSDLELTRTIELRTSSPFNEMDESEISSLYSPLFNSYSLISSISLLVI